MKDKYSLIGIDSHAFAIMGYVRKCMKKEDKSQEEIKAYTESAMSGDYNNLLYISSSMIDTLNQQESD